MPPLPGSPRTHFLRLSMPSTYNYEVLFSHVRLTSISGNNVGVGNVLCNVRGNMETNLRRRIRI